MKMVACRSLLASAFGLKTTTSTAVVGRPRRTHLQFKLGKSSSSRQTQFTAARRVGGHSTNTRLAANKDNVDVVEVEDSVDENCSIDSFEVDVAVGGKEKTLTFGEVCDEFKCTSSPAVGISVRRIARDMVEGYEGERSLANFAENVEYQVRL